MCYMYPKIFQGKYEPGTNIMVGTNITQAGTHVIDRNQYYSCLAFRPECLTARNKYYATPVTVAVR
jgi:hypothetical protein